MVTLNHQDFWQPTPNSLQRFSSVGSETQTMAVAEQLNTSREEASGYSLENNVLEEEDRVMNFASEIDRFSRPVSPDTYPKDAPAADNYPSYPEEVALYPSSRVSSTASVTGLDGPGTMRVFDVFEDEHMQFTANRRKRALEDLSIPSPKRRRYPYLTTISATKSRGRRTNRPEAENSSFHGEEDYADNHLAGLGNAIRYLKRFYSHAYGIIATSTISIENPVRQATTVQARQTTTRRKWTSEDDRHLFKLRDSQKLPWSRMLHVRRKDDSIRYHQRKYQSWRKEEGKIGIVGDFCLSQATIVLFVSMPNFHLASTSTSHC
ncbi:uncharacterized protein N7515_009496 [Penicillium bovifimosum]|uniref:Uncharacterized protein n=1 Tax=Penicillium bovifimosum TaxID=126998 RepID=A0A9W9KW23_9EURO|nr:uncharacterized protein N7515_009496 [Penicillium bovifimosum]KAJ5121535.1 hypothetical protein N7515_009496 [Penicillium bovifimosum]